MNLGGIMGDYMGLLVSIIFAVVVLLVMTAFSDPIIDSLVTALTNTDIASFPILGALGQVVPVGYWVGMLVVAFLPVSIAAIGFTRGDRNGF